MGEAICSSVSHVYLTYWITEPKDAPQPPAELKQAILKKGVGWKIIAYDQSGGSKAIYLSPGETKTFSYEYKVTLDASGLPKAGTYSIDQRILVRKWVKSSVKTKEVRSGCVIYHKKYVYVKFYDYDASYNLFRLSNVFSKTAFSKLIHIENVVADAKTGKVSFTLVNHLGIAVKVKPILTYAWIGDPPSISGSGKVVGAIATIPANGEIRVNLVDQGIANHFKYWKPGDPTEVKRKLFVEVVEAGGADPRYWGKYVSALIVFRYARPEYTVGFKGFEVVAPTGSKTGDSKVSVEFYLEGKRVQPPFKAKAGDVVTVVMNGYEDDRYEVYPVEWWARFSNGRKVGDTSPLQKLVKRKWSFMVEGDALVYVKFVKRDKWERAVAYVSVTTVSFQFSF